MASWLGNLINPFRGKEAPALALGAFGKHPGWDDHIEDFGLETEALLAARQLLYVQGVGGVIDSGAWEKMPPAEVSPDFAHVFVWFSEPDLLVGRMWSSHDRKGRDRYPMVVCAHAASLPVHAAMEQILPALQKTESDCKQATTAEAVQGILEAVRQNLRGQLLGAPLSLDGAAPFSDIAGRLHLAPENDEWLRNLYSAETQFTAYTAGKIPDGAKRLSTKLAALPAIPQHLRLPTDQSRLADVALFWQNLVTQILQTTAPTLVIQPLGHPWMDLIVGCPGPKQLVCLKALAKAIPLAQEVPYNLPGAFREKAAGVFHKLCERP